MKKAARLSASELAEVQEGRGEDDLRCSRWLIVCQRERKIRIHWYSIGLPCTPCTVDLLSTNGFGTGRVSWYASRRLVNVYKVRLNVYKIKR